MSPKYGYCYQSYVITTRRGQVWLFLSKLRYKDWLNRLFLSKAEIESQARLFLSKSQFLIMTWVPSTVILDCTYVVEHQFNFGQTLTDIGWIPFSTNGSFCQPYAFLVWNDGKGYRNDEQKKNTQHYSFLNCLKNWATLCLIEQRLESEWTEKVRMSKNVIKNARIND